MDDIIQALVTLRDECRGSESCDDCDILEILGMCPSNELYLPEEWSLENDV